MVFKIKLSTLIILLPFPGFCCPRLMNIVQLFSHALVISAFVLAPSLFLKRSSVHLSSVSSVTQSCPTLCQPMDCGRPGFPIHYQCLELAQTHVHWVNDTIQPSHPPSSPSPLAFNLSQHHGLFQQVSSLHQWSKNWSFSFSISPSSVHLGLTSFRTEWFDLLVVKGALKSLLQHHSSKASILRRSAFFMVSHTYMATEKNHSFD